MDAQQLALPDAQFDVVLNMEVVEHVADPLAYLTACQHLLRPGGLMICSTLNRNAKSFAMAIVGAEYVMRWLPKGTHDWKKFITPDELYDLIRRAGLDPVDRKGMVVNPLGWSWSLSARDLAFVLGALMALGGDHVAAQPITLEEWRRRGLSRGRQWCTGQHGLGSRGWRGAHPGSNRHGPRRRAQVGWIKQQCVVANDAA